MRAAYTIASVCFVALYPFIHATALTAQTGSMRVTVPSPTAASLGKFGDVPVSLYTGVPDISIPLFTVKGRTLALPITLRYHAGGIRVEEIGGWAGLGWTLEAGGAITRTVRGLVDEGGGGYYHTGHNFYNSSNWPNPTNTLIQSILDRTLDGEPDRFFFSFAGRSGQFVMGPTSTSSSIKEYRTIPHQKLRIVPTFGVGGITRWEITAEDGTRYTFAAAETTTDYSLVTYSGGGTPIPDNYGDSHKSSWHLTEIRSPGGDVINLYYGTYTVRHRPSAYRERFDQRVSSSPEQCVPSQYDVRNEYRITVQRLDSIKAAAHTVRFSTTLRSDALSPAGAQQERRLDRISVRTPTGTEIRRFQFEHDYYPGNRLRLKNVYEQDRYGVSLPPYTFTYDSQTLPARTSFALDHWGYYNGENNTTSIPAMTGQAGIPLSGADRTPDPASMKAGILTRITYPTGGYNEFVYEANDYGGIGQSGATPIGDSPQQSVWATSYDGEGVVSEPFTVGGTYTITATVHVDKDPSGCETQLTPPCPVAEIPGLGKFTAGTHQVSLAPGSYTLRASADGSGGFASINVQWRDRAAAKKKTAGGLRVAEVRTVDAMGNTTTRRYKYTLRSDTTKSSGVINAEPAYGFAYSSSLCSYFSRSSMSKMPLGEGPIVGYSEVTVWHGANAEHGKTRHTFRSVRNAGDVVPISSVWPYSTRTSYEWKRGQQTGATEYNASGQVQQRTASAYRFRDQPSDSMTTRRFRGMSINEFSGGRFGSTRIYQPFEIISAWAHPVADTAFIHNEAGGSAFSTVKSYTYGNPNHLQLTEVTETNSDGTRRITRMKYPADYATGSGDPVTAALTAMQGTAHMHALAIERWVVEKTGSTEEVVRAELTTFKEFAPGKILPYQHFLLLPSVP